MKPKQWQMVEWVCLIGATACLLAAAVLPSTPLVRDSASYLIFVDVTQSMNVQDMTLAGQRASRMEFTKYLLKKAIKKAPCGTRIGLGVFFRSSIALLFNPIESCKNYNEILDTIDHLEWRMASQGSSNIRMAIQDMPTILAGFDQPPKVVFITDGDEAPPLNPFTKVSLAGWQGEPGWLLVGVGDEHAMPIPKLNSKNKVIGYWSLYSIKIQPASRVNEGPNNVRDESLATEPYEYYLSKLNEPYLKEIATDIKADYHRLQSDELLAKAFLGETSFLTKLIHEISFRSLLAIFAFILVFSLYLPNLLTKIMQNKRLK